MRAVVLVIFSLILVSLMFSHGVTIFLNNTCDSLDSYFSNVDVTELV